MKRQLDMLTRAGLISRWEGYCEWLSGLTFPPKKDDDLIFLCLFVGLNARTVLDKYPLPRIDRILEDLAGHNWNSIFDGFSGYYAMELTEESKPLIALLTPFGIFVWNVLPFGFTNGTPKYSRLMETVYGDLPRTKTFVDDT